MSTLNNKKFSKKEFPSIPAYAVFCDPLNAGEDQAWLSWGLSIKRLREYSGLDRAIFARLIGGYSMQQIGRYENEQTEPPIDFWLKMMRMFGLNITWAISGHGCPYVTGFENSDERKKFTTWMHKAAEKEDFLKDLKGD